MTLISRDDLKQVLADLDAHLSERTELLLVGGSALLVLSQNAIATRDLDAFPTDSYPEILRAFQEMKSGDKTYFIDINTQSASFESYMPENWQERIQFSEEFSTNNIRVFTPSAEDISVMKVFRFVAKDAEDIKRLAALRCFSREKFLEGFLKVLPAAVGEPRWHAQSFSLIWNRLYPDRSLDMEELLARAGI